MAITVSGALKRRGFADGFSLHRCLFTTVAALALFAGQALAAQQAGIAAGVAGAVQVSEGERAAPEPVATGMEMMILDRVQSEATGRMQVLLLDETVFTVGPGSDLVIDEFVYDPSSGAGKLTANFTKGMLRYVSGKVAAVSPGGVTIKTASATVGVRGTALFITDVPAQGDEEDDPNAPATQFIGLLGPGSRNDGNLKAGGMTVTGGGRSVNVYRAGYGVFISPGQGPGDSVPTPEWILQIMANNLTGQLRGQEGEQEGEADGNGSQAEENSGADQAAAGARAGELNRLLGDQDETDETGNQAAQDSGTERAVSRFDFGTILNSNTEGNLPEGEIFDHLLVLQWMNIGDVDLHLTGLDDGGRFHVFYANEGSLDVEPFILLDEDNSAGFGLSTAELIGAFDGEGGPITSPDEPIRVIAFHYDQRHNDNSGELSDPANGVRFTYLQDAQISRGNGGTSVTTGNVIASATPPPGQIGHTWTIADFFEVDDTQVVTPINVINNAHTDGLGVPLD